MADSYSVVAKLSADVGNFTKGMAQAQSSLKDLESNVKGMNLGDIFKGAGDVLANTGKALTKGVTLPLAAVGTMALKTGMEFEQQMNRVSAISGATGDDLAKLEKQAIDLGASSVFGATEVAQSQEMLASAGLTTNEILAATPGIMDLAAVSGGDMALASEAAATAMNQFGLEASESAHVADVFAKAAADTNAETSDMAEALKYAGPVAGALGISLEETAAAIGIMSDAGIKGSQAGTTMRGALTRLVKPTKKARDTMDELGLSFFDAQGNMLPFGEIIGQLQGKLGGLTQEQKQQAITTLFGQEAMSGMLALIGSAPGEFDALTESLENSDGSAKTMADTINSGLAGAVEQLKGSLESAAIVISQTLGPMIEQLAVYISGLVDAFNTLSPAQQENIVKWALIAASAGPILLILGKLIAIITTVVGWFFTFGGAIQAAVVAFQAGSTALGALKIGMLALTGPVGWVVIGILALIAAGVLLWQNWDIVKQKLTELKDKFIADWTELQTIVGAAITTLKDAALTDFEELKTGITTAVTTLKDAAIEDFNELNTIGSNAVETLKTAAIADATELSTGATNAIETLRSAAVSDFEELKTTGSNAMETLKSAAVSDAEELKSGAVGAFGKLRSSAITDFNELKDGGIRAWNSLKTNTTEIFNNVKDTITSAFDGIDLFSAGKAIIDGFGRGLKSAYEGVKSFVGGIAGWIEAHKGPISYDKKLLIGAGNAIMDGLNKGLQSKFKDVQSTVSSMGGQLQGTFNGGLSTSAFDISASARSLNGSVNQSVDHIVSDNLNNGKQPLNLNVQLGNRAYKLFVDDISNTQNAQAQLVETYL